MSESMKPPLEGLGGGTKEKEAQPKQIEYSSLRDGDRLTVKTANSEYRFVVFFDSAIGKMGLREVSPDGKLSGTEGIPVFDTQLKVGATLRYGDPEKGTLYQTSSVVDFQLDRNPANARQGASELSDSDRSAIDSIRQSLGRK